MELEKNHPEKTIPDPEKRMVCTQLYVDISCEVSDNQASFQKLTTRPHC